MKKRFGVVSADGHCRLMHLPFDLWTKRLPRRLQDDAPRVATGPDGARRCPRATRRPRRRSAKKALQQLVFDNAVNLYKIPVSLPQQQAAE